MLPPSFLPPARSRGRISVNRWCTSLLIFTTLLESMKMARGDEPEGLAMALQLFGHFLDGRYPKREGLRYPPKALASRSKAHRLRRTSVEE
jgi:hypothetical protein